MGLPRMNYQTQTTYRSKPMLKVSEAGRMEGPIGSSEPPQHTWREVFGVAVVVGCLALGMVAAMAGVKAWKSGDVPAHVTTQAYIVRPGDTAWSVASKDTAFGMGQVEQWIVDHYGDVLQPGQVIRIPEGEK